VVEKYGRHRRQRLGARGRGYINHAITFSQTDQIAKTKPIASILRASGDWFQRPTLLDHAFIMYQRVARADRDVVVVEAGLFPSLIIQHSAANDEHFYLPSISWTTTAKALFGQVHHLLLRNRVQGRYQPLLHSSKNSYSIHRAELFVERSHRPRRRTN